jgi:adenylate kinase
MRRPDDSDHVVQERLKAYAANTSPVAEYYRAKGQLREIARNCRADSVAAEIARLINTL